MQTGAGGEVEQVIGPVRAPERRACSVAGRRGRGEGSGDAARRPGAPGSCAGLPACAACAARIGTGDQSLPIAPRLRVVTAVLAGRPRPVVGAAGAGLAAAPVGHARRARGAVAAGAGRPAVRALRPPVSAGSCSAWALPACCTSGRTSLLADEPVSALDPTLADADAAATGGAERIDRRDAGGLAARGRPGAALGFPRIVGMRDGQVMFDAPVGEVTPQMLDALYASEGASMQGATDATPVRAAAVTCRGGLPPRPHRCTTRRAAGSAGCGGAGDRLADAAAGRSSTRGAVRRPATCR